VIPVVPVIPVILYHMRRTKIVCTIGPATAQFEKILALAQAGMNVARLNMSHGTHEWHQQIIRAIHTINEKGIFCIAILLDTKGPEVRSGDLKRELTITRGDQFVFTIKREAEYPDYTTEVSYDGFVSDVKKGDVILVDGGMLSFRVVSKTATDVICECVDGGVFTSRRHLHIKGKSSRAPTISKKDWRDIDFGISEKVDFIALSFVKDAKSVRLLKEYLKKKHAPIDVIAKIESAVSLPRLSEIVEASDGVMIARGDLGAEVPLEEVPLIQEDIVVRCRSANKPVIVATHLLESMIIHPTPTRAEVTDIAEAVKERADAIMLSGETAAGKFPNRAVSIMDRVAVRIEKKLTENRVVECESSTDPTREIARNAVILANNLSATALVVFTRRGFTATLLSRCRPNCQIYAFTNTTTVRRRLNLYWGVTPFRIEFSQEPEKTIQRALAVLSYRKLLSAQSRIVVVSDILVGQEFIETIQVREVK